MLIGSGWLFQEPNHEPQDGHGSGKWDRTTDITGMNRLLYQLSYPATILNNKGAKILR